MTIITNNVPRDVLDAWELSAAERARFDYLDWDAIAEGTDSASFVRYRGWLYDMSEFTTTWGLSRDAGLPDVFAGWHGYLSDSFFSGVLVRYVDDGDRVIVGRFFS